MYRILDKLGFNSLLILNAGHSKSLQGKLIWLEQIRHLNHSWSQQRYIFQYRDKSDHSQPRNLATAYRKFSDRNYYLFVQSILIWQRSV